MNFISQYHQNIFQFSIKSSTTIFSPLHSLVWTAYKIIGPYPSVLGRTCCAGHNISMIAGNPQGILDQQLMPHPINF
jgi:hypothetical protein